MVLEYLPTFTQIFHTGSIWAKQIWEVLRATMRRYGDIIETQLDSTRWILIFNTCPKKTLVDISILVGGVP